MPELEQPEAAPQQDPLPLVGTSLPVSAPQPQNKAGVRVLRQQAKPKVPSIFQRQNGPQVAVHSMKCPSRSYAITPAAVLCINCGLDFRTGKKRKLVDAVDVPKPFPLKPIRMAASILLVCGFAGCVLMGKGSKPSPVAPPASAGNNQVQSQTVIQSKATAQTQSPTTAKSVEPVKPQPIEAGTVEKPAAKAVAIARYGSVPGGREKETLSPPQLFEQGLKYLKGEGVVKDENKAYALITKSAEQGYARAQFGLGNCYAKGEGLTKDLTKAAEWFRKAAEQGYAKAQNNLGLCYYNGAGVTKNVAQAVEWFRKAAEQGAASAQYNLGRCYANGAGVPKDLTKAVELYRKAAEQGNAVAQCRLGTCYLNGDGVTKDLAKAAEWYREASGLLRKDGAKQ